MANTTQVPEHLYLVASLMDHWTRLENESYATVLEQKSKQVKQLLAEMQVMRQEQLDIIERLTQVTDIASSLEQVCADQAETILEYDNMLNIRRRRRRRTTRHEPEVIDLTSDTEMSDNLLSDTMQLH